MAVETQKYSVNQYLVNNILNWVQSGDIAIPEIQRPFVWKAAKVRDLIDSLYQGFPVGYIIAWRNPNVRLKDGTLSEGKKVLIDGQQRVTALTAALLGQEVIDQNYKKSRITIAFHPIEERFEVSNPAIRKNDIWIDDISTLFVPEFDAFTFVVDYCEKVDAISQRDLSNVLNRVIQLANKQVGFIELDADLDIDTVTEIFIRINSKGVVLSQADFAMSKIASHGDFGVNLRKCIDYFCHLAIAPEFHDQLVTSDEEFGRTEYLDKISWLKNDREDLYDPSYSDMLHVAFTSEFGRGKLSDLVSLLSGRNFETRSFEQSIADDSFRKLEKGVLRFVNETNFKRFMMILRSAGFISVSQIRSVMAVNFAYILYLKLVDQGMDAGSIESYVRRWYVMSNLTGRYSGSSETAIDEDAKDIDRKGVESILGEIERGELSDAFWDVQLVTDLEKATINNAQINTFFAAQVKANDRGFLSRDIRVGDMIQHRGDIHHMFPVKYMKQYNNSRKVYNQIANWVYTQQEVNIRIGAKPPHEYMSDVVAQCEGGPLVYGAISDMDDLKANLAENAVPELILTATFDDYDEFLSQRRTLMAKKIRHYYEGL